MPYSDPITQRQVDYILSLGRQVIDGGEELELIELEEELNRMVYPIYEATIERFNKGQAGMLIETLKYESGESDEEPDHPSII